MQVKTVRIDSLRLDDKNARKHSERNLAAIAESLSRFGQRKPIVVRGLKVLAGNGTLEAARSLNWTEIQVAEAPDDWDDDTAKAYALADNRTAELAEWDEAELAKQLLELEDAQWDIEALGFELPKLHDVDVDEDEIPEPPAEPVTKLGDIWQLGRHRLMCGDSTDEATVSRLMDGARADMVFTDPPYGVAYTGGLQFGANGEVEKNNREMIKNDDKDIYAEVFEILSKFSDGACYIWFAGTKAATLYQAAEKHGDIHALIIWVKNGGYGALNANYKQKHEPCLYWKPRGKTLKFTGETTETTVWEINKDGKNTLHPTQKPVALATKAITNHDGRNVLDLFGGSGSTLIAAEQTNRTCYMMELDPKYCDVIIKRWETLTGLKAELVM